MSQSSTEKKEATRVNTEKPAHVDEVAWFERDETSVEDPLVQPPTEAAVLESPVAEISETEKHNRELFAKKKFSPPTREKSALDGNPGGQQRYNHFMENRTGVASKYFK